MPPKEFDVCVIEGCDIRKISVNGHCNKHASQYRIGYYAQDCSIEGCTKVIKARNYCATHYRRLMEGEKVDGPIRASKGSGSVNKSGYRRLTMKGHPNASPGRGNIFEHTLVMSEYLGRPLLPYENVHHKNGVRDDNRIENLELWSTSQPPGQRVLDKLQWAHEIIALYENDKELHDKLC